MPVASRHYSLNQTPLPSQSHELGSRFVSQLVHRKHPLALQVVLYPDPEPSLETSYVRFVAIMEFRHAIAGDTKDTEDKYTLSIVRGLGQILVTEQRLIGLITHGVADGSALDESAGSMYAFAFDRDDIRPVEVKTNWRGQPVEAVIESKIGLGSPFGLKVISVEYVLNNDGNVSRATLLTFLERVASEQPNWFQRIFGGRKNKDNHQNIGSTRNSSGRVSRQQSGKRIQNLDARTSALLDELEDLVQRDVDPHRQEAICRQILETDDQAHVLNALARSGVLGRRGSALKGMAGAVGVQVHVSLLREAIDCFNAALRECPQDNDPQQWAAILSNKGTVLNDLGRTEHGAERAQTLRDAIACFDAALEVFRRDNAPLEWATVQNNKGNALDDLAQGQGGVEYEQTLRAAITCYEKALLERRRNNVPLEWATTQNNKGGALAELSREQSGAERAQTLRDAIACFDAALWERRRDNAPLDWAMTQNNMAGTLGLLAEGQHGAERAQTLRDAIACFDAALEVFRRDNAPLEWAMTQNNKGHILGALSAEQFGTKREETLREAIDSLDAALLEWRRDTAPLQWATAHTNKGDNLLRLATRQFDVEREQTLQEAIDCYDNALRERHRDTASLQWAETQNDKGVALSELAREQRGDKRAATLRTAAAVFRDALTTYRPELQPGDYRRTARVLGDIYLTLATAVVDDHPTEQTLLTQAWQVASSAIAAADLLELRAPSLAFRQQEWAENASLYNLAACIRARQGHIDEAIALIERGRARGLAEAAGRRSAELYLLDPADRAQYLLAMQRVQEVEAAGRLGGNPLALVEDARAANQRLEEVVARLRAAYPTFLPERHVSISTLVAALQPGEALVYLIPREAGTLLLVVPSGGTEQTRVQWLADLTEEDIVKLATQPNPQGEREEGLLPAALGWYPEDSTMLARALDALLPRLGDKLMRVVVSLVRSADCYRAVLVPSGHLAVLPLHAANYEPLAGEPPTAPDGRRYACDDIAFTYAPSGLVYLDTRQHAAHHARRSPAKRMFVAGNPQLTRKGEAWTQDSPNYLRFAEWEARRVTELAMQRHTPLAVDLVLNQEATWKQVVEGLGLADLAHLALHATFDFQDPQQSALLVAFQAKLMFRTLLDPGKVKLSQLRLVVLSACQSAIGDFSEQTEEAVGLFGALLAGGVPGVVGTLWSVNDQATAALMESFTRRYLVEGQAPDAALRAAARELRGVPDHAANPAEMGTACGDVPNSTEEITTVGYVTIPHETPARRRWAELEARDPTKAGDSRHLNQAELVRITKDVQAFKQVPREHPIYWAAFVFHGAALPLGDSATGHAGLRSTDKLRRTTPPEGIMSDDDDQQQMYTRLGTTGQRQSDAEEIPEAGYRAPGYFPAATEVCPNCHAEDYITVRDAEGHDMRQCECCGTIYHPGSNGAGR